MDGRHHSETRIHCATARAFDGGRFRQSTEAVGASRFGPVRESCANEKYHNTRNVGVIGVALFNEAGTNPYTWEEVRRRLRANPFPGQFGTPP
jgi:hypothetical protein